MNHEQRVAHMQSLDRLHTAVANAMVDAPGAIRAELEAIEERVMSTRQVAGLSRDEVMSDDS